MVEIVRESVAKDGARGRLELAYGPGGTWSNLFARCPGFRGMTLPLVTGSNPVAATPRGNACQAPSNG